MKIIKILFVSFLFVTAFAYLLGAFYSGTFNCDLWKHKDLMILIYLSIGIPIIGISTAALNEQIN